MLFGAIDTAGSGLVAYRKWMDAVSDNISNADDVRRTSQAAYQSHAVLVNPATGTDGVRVSAAVVSSSAAGRVVFDPGHPLADAQGNVRMPDIDMGDQMTQLMMAQRGYQANLAVVDRVRDAYQAALQLGR